MFGCHSVHTELKAFFFLFFIFIQLCLSPTGNESCSSGPGPSNGFLIDRLGSVGGLLEKGESNNKKQLEHRTTKKKKVKPGRLTEKPSDSCVASVF